MTARQRYKERHQVHRKMHLRNSASKSCSEDKSLSLSSSENVGPTSVHLSADSNNLRVCLNDDNGLEAHDIVGPESSSSVHKPTYLELKQTNSPAKASSANSAPVMTTFRRAEPSQSYHHHPLQEYHPRANTRIYHQPQMTANKPKLRREYSVSYEPATDLPHQPASVPSMVPYEQPPDLVQDHSSNSKRPYGSNYVNMA